MTIEAKVLAVQTLFSKLDLEIATFQHETKLHCQVGCGKCCTHPEIDASPLEFLPWAFRLFLDGEAESMLHLLEENTQSTCQNYRQIGVLEAGIGNCKTYVDRGLICRLFGYGANQDKHGHLRLATCKLIKENQVEFFAEAEKKIENGLSVPVFTAYYMQLSHIDYNLGATIVPINTALRLALEEVLRYYYYHPLNILPAIVA